MGKFKDTTRLPSLARINRQAETCKGQYEDYQETVVVWAYLEGHGFLTSNSMTIGKATMHVFPEEYGRKVLNFDE